MILNIYILGFSNTSFIDLSKKLEKDIISKTLMEDYYPNSLIKKLKQTNIIPISLMDYKYEIVNFKKDDFSIYVKPNMSEIFDTDGVDEIQNRVKVLCDELEFSNINKENDFKNKCDFVYDSKIVNYTMLHKKIFSIIEERG